MALFCQVFKNQLRFNQEFTNQVEFLDSIGQVNYGSRFNVCADGHIRCTLVYDSVPTNDISNDLYHHFGERINDVYKSPILDISVDMKKEMNGYLPGVKRMYSEHVFYDGCYHCDSQKYEDRGVKHLYEFHHSCSSSSGYCNSFCNVKLTEGNQKLNDVFHVENGEIVCLDSAVNYTNCMIFTLSMQK